MAERRDTIPINGRLDGQAHDVTDQNVVAPARPRRPAYDPWRDTDGNPIPQHCRIQQVAVGKKHGALPSRLHKQGEVLGRGITRLNVRFNGEDTVVSIRPHLVRVLTTPGGR